MTNPMRPRQICRHFAYVIVKCILHSLMHFLKEYIRISSKISLKFVPKDPIYSIPAFVQVMVWCQIDDKHYLNQRWIRFVTHICVTRPHWVDLVHITTRISCFSKHSLYNWIWTQFIHSLEDVFCSILELYDNCLMIWHHRELDLIVSMS